MVLILSLISSFCANLHFHIPTEVLGDRNTVEVMAIRTIVNRCYVEQDDKNNTYTYSKECAQHNGDDTLLTDGGAFFGDTCKWQNAKGDEEAEDKPEDVCIVVNHRQEPKDEEHKDEA